MRRRDRITRGLAVGLIAGMLTFSGVAFWGMRSDLATLKAFTQDNLMWSALQLEVELLRFSKALADFHAGMDGVDAYDVNDRFDILWSRVAGFEVGKVGSSLATYDQSFGVIADVRAALNEFEPVILDIETASPEDRAEVAQAFADNHAKARMLSIAVLQGQEAVRTATEAKLEKSATHSALLSLGTLTFTVLLVIYLALETRKAKRLAQSNLELARKAELSSRVKSQFLTMMSHELRTPMNGVLGLLALARQSAIPDGAVNLLAQAERSGRLMLGMLADILDFSALQDGSMKFKREIFSPHRLGQEVTQDINTHLAQHGTQIRLNSDISPYLRLEGDTLRLSQCIRHIALYLLETAGTNALELGMRYEDDQLSMELRFAYAPSGARWTPDLILGAPERDANQFAADALGPAVARGVIDRMGGHLAIDEGQDGSIRVIMSVPMKDIAKGQVKVALDTGSAFLPVIFERALSGSTVALVSLCEDAPPDYIIVDCAEEDSLEKFPNLRARFPHAKLLELLPSETRTTTSEVQAVDGVLTMPLRPDILRAMFTPNDPTPFEHAAARTA